MLATCGLSACAKPPLSNVTVVGGSEHLATELNVNQVARPIKSLVLRLRTDNGKPVVVTAIAAHPNNDLLAVAGDDYRIRIVNCRDFQVAQTIASHNDIIRTLSFDPQGQRLVSAGNDGQIIIWDGSQGYRPIQKMGGSPAIARICFSPSGDELAAVGFDNSVYLIGRRGLDRPVLSCSCRDLRAVDYCDDCSVLGVAGRSGKLHLFSGTNGQEIGEFAIHQTRVNDLVFCPASSHAITIGEDGQVARFDTNRQRLSYRRRITKGKLFSITMINSQLAAVAGSDNVIRIVNIDTGDVIEQLEGHRGSVPTLVASGGYLFSGGFDATLRRWPLDAIGEHEERIAENVSPSQR